MLRCVLFPLSVVVACCVQLSVCEPGVIEDIAVSVHHVGNQVRRTVHGLADAVGSVLRPQRGWHKGNYNPREQHGHGHGHGHGYGYGRPSWAGHGGDDCQDGHRYPGEHGHGGYPGEHAHGGRPGAHIPGGYPGQHGHGGYPGAQGPDMYPGGQDQGGYYPGQGGDQYPGGQGNDHSGGGNGSPGYDDSGKGTAQVTQMPLPGRPQNPPRGGQNPQPGRPQYPPGGDQNPQPGRPQYPPGDGGQPSGPPTRPPMQVDKNPPSGGAGTSNPPRAPGKTEEEDLEEVFQLDIRGNFNETEDEVPLGIENRSFIDVPAGCSEGKRMVGNRCRDIVKR